MVIVTFKCLYWYTHSMKNSQLYFDCIILSLFTFARHYIPYFNSTQHNLLILQTIYLLKIKPDPGVQWMSLMQLPAFRFHICMFKSADALAKILFNRMTLYTNKYGFLMFLRICLFSVPNFNGFIEWTTN